MPVTLSDFTALDARAEAAGIVVEYYHETYYLKKNGRVIKETTDFIDALLVVAEAKWALEAVAN